MACSRSIATAALPKSASMRPKCRIGQMYMLVANRKKKNSPAPSEPPDTNVRPTINTTRICAKHVTSLNAQNCESPSNKRISASRCAAFRSRNSSRSNDCRPNARTTRIPAMFSCAFAVRRPSASSFVRNRSLTVRKYKPAKATTGIANTVDAIAMRQSMANISGIAISNSSIARPISAI